MRRPLINKIATAFAVIATLVFEFFAVMVLVSGIRDGWINGPLDMGWIAVALFSPVIALYGLYLSWRWPFLGGALAVGAAVPMGAMFYWFPPFWGLALIVAAIAVTRARRFARVSPAV